MPINVNKIKDKNIFSVLINTIILSLIIIFFIFSFKFLKSFLKPLENKEKIQLEEIIKYLDQNKEYFFKNYYIFLKNKYILKEESTLAEIKKKIDIFEDQEKKLEKIIEYLKQKNIPFDQEEIKIKKDIISNTKNIIKTFFTFSNKGENYIFFKKKYSDYLEDLKNFDKNFDITELKIINEKLDFFYSNRDFCERAKEILDQEFYGQKRLKEKIIEEFLIKKNESNINYFFLLGCNSNGKTTFVKNFAKAIEYEFIKIIVNKLNKLYIIDEILETALKLENKKIVILLMIRTSEFDHDFFIKKIKEKIKIEKYKDIENILFFQTDNQNKIYEYKKYGSVFKMEFYKSHDLNNIFIKNVVEEIIDIKEFFFNEILKKYFQNAREEEVNKLKKFIFDNSDKSNIQIKFEKFFLSKLLAICQDKNTNEIFDSKKCICKTITGAKINKIIGLFRMKISKILFSNLEKIKSKKEIFDLRINVFFRSIVHYPDIFNYFKDECQTNAKSEECKN